MDDIKKLIQRLNFNATFEDMEDAEDRLVKLGKPAVPALIEALKDECWTRRSSAAYILGRMGDVSAVPALIDALRDAWGFWGMSFEVRQRATWALGEIGNPSAVYILTEILNEKDEKGLPKSNAAEALGKIGDTRAVPVLVEALGAEYDRLVGKASEALSKIVGKCDTLEALESLENDLSEGFDALRGKQRDKDKLIEIKMKIVRLVKQVSERKNELASKRDVLLDAKPKPPERGKMYQSIRRVRNG